MGCASGKQIHHNNNNQMNSKKGLPTQNTISSCKSATIDINSKIDEQHPRQSDYFESADLCLEIVRAIKQRKREQYCKDSRLASRLSME